MSSPPRRRRRAPRTMETQGAVRTTHQSLPELDAYPAKFCLMSVPSFHLSLGMLRGLHCCPVNVNTPMLPHKLLHLKSLEIKLHRSGESPIYDIFSVVSFLDASPALESFILHAERDAIIHDCVAWDDLYPMGESAYKHDRLRRVKITGFHSAKSLIKFVIHILESAPSLESLMLDTTNGYGQRAGDASKCTASRRRGKCSFMSERDIKDANSAVEAAGRYISGRVPSAVEYEVLEPCRRCHTGNQTVDEGWWVCFKQHSVLAQLYLASSLFSPTALSPTDPARRRKYGGESPATSQPAQPASEARWLQRRRILLDWCGRGTVLLKTGECCDAAAGASGKGKVATRVLLRPPGKRSILFYDWGGWYVAHEV
ncbi:hypothetical protein ACQ4PT_033697 [Festuca glaucescens]